MFALLKTIRIFAPILKREAYGRLAQLVQSICLTSRGSAVRIRQRPLQGEGSSQKIDIDSFFYALFHYSEKKRYFCTLIIIILDTTYET